MLFFVLSHYPNKIRYFIQIKQRKNVGIWPKSIHTFCKYIYLLYMYSWALMNSIDSEIMRILNKNKTTKPEAFWRRQIVNYKFGCFTEKSFFSHFSLSFGMVATAYEDEKIKKYTERKAIKTILHGKIDGKLHWMKNEMHGKKEIMSGRNILLLIKTKRKRRRRGYGKMNRVRAVLYSLTLRDGSDSDESLDSSRFR